MEWECRLQPSTPTRPVVAVDSPQQMVIKQGHLVVLGQDSGSLFFIDLNSNEVVGSLEFPDSKAQTLCASSVANDFVYCFNFTTGPDRALQMIQVDLRQRTVLRQTILA